MKSLLGGMRILLINSPNEVDVTHQNSNFSLFPHIGIVQLATRIKETFKSEVVIKIVDGGIVPLATIKSIISDFKPELTGISILTPSYIFGLEIASFAKKNKSLVIFGDDHAIFFPKIILEKRLYVDFIVANDVGEQPFFELIDALINKKPLSNVCSLAYRDEEGFIKLNPPKKYLLSQINTIPDLSLIEDVLPIYGNKYYQTYGHLHNQKYVRAITVNNIRGCENGRYRCSYCSIADLAINSGNPVKFWEMVHSYHEMYGINLFFEVCDSFTASSRYVISLLESMPINISKKIENGEIEFMVYARALGLLKKNNVDKFKRLGIKRINIGLDSGDSKMLEAQRKNKTSNETNLDALHLLNQADITVHGSFIFGALGETEESIQYTIDHIKHSINEVKFSSIEVSRLYPLPNCPIWDMMVEFRKPQFYKNTDEIISAIQAMNITIKQDIWDELEYKYSNQDLFVAEEMMLDWYKNFTHVDKTYVENCIKQIDEFISSNNINTGNNVG